MLDSKSTRIFLVGIADYKDSELHPLDSVYDNINTLHKIFTSETCGKIPRERITRRFDIEKSTFLNELNDIVKKKDFKNLIVYYAGHGIPLAKEVYLSTKDTIIENIKITGVKVSELEDIFDGENINIVLILDCCFSERVFKEFKHKNYLVLASSGLNQASKYPPNEEFSVFTKAFIDIIEKGITNNKRYISVIDLFRQLKQDLSSNKKPEPKLIITSELIDFIIAQNNFNSNGSEIIKNDKEHLEYLFDCLEAYNSDLRKEREYITDPSVYWQRLKKLILDSYPSNISFQLKNLLPDATFVNTNYLINFYNQIIKFLCFILLSQIVDQRKKYDIDLGLDFKELIIQFHKPNSDFYLSLIEVIVDKLKSRSEPVPLYIEEFNFFDNDLQDIIKTFKGFSTIPFNEINFTDCKNKLIIFLGKLAFLSNYSLASVRKIDVIRKKYTYPISFLHEISILKGESPASYSTSVAYARRDYYLHSNSVLLFKGRELQSVLNEYLNLWPFVIDVNAFYIKSDTPELHFYEFKDDHIGYLYKVINLLDEEIAKPYKDYDKHMTNEELHHQIMTFESNLIL